MLRPALRVCVTKALPEPSSPLMITSAVGVPEMSARGFEGDRAGRVRREGDGAVESRPLQVTFGGPAGAIELTFVIVNP